MSDYKQQMDEFKQQVAEREDEFGFIFLHDFMSLTPPARPPVRELTPEERQTVNWEMLVARQPKLAGFLATCMALGRKGGPWSTKVRRWTPALREELDSLVGWNADSTDPVIRSSAAYDVARETCFDAVTRNTRG